MKDNIEIRLLYTKEELELVQVLEKAVWNEQPVPIHQTLTAAKNGGIIVGAFHGQKLVGFSYGFPGFQNGKAYLCSHMLGIDEDYRKKGIGAILKAAQKKAAIDKGYSLLTWTYDPLESVNAFLNLTKLKAICSTYIENCYGEMEDELNQGLPSDRFQVEWWIKSSHLEKELEFDHTQMKQIPYVLTEDGQPVLEEIHSSQFLDEETLLVPVPKNFQQLKKDHYDLAYDWRLKTRQLFQTLFSNGFAAVHVLKRENEPVVYYVIQKRHILSLDE
jgi:predicted GNAT superfamily acetyltransferase